MLNYKLFEKLHALQSKLHDVPIFYRKQHSIRKPFFLVIFVSVNY